MHLLFTGQGSATGRRERIYLKSFEGIFKEVFTPYYHRVVVRVRVRVRVIISPRYYY